MRIVELGECSLILCLSTLPDIPLRNALSKGDCYGDRDRTDCTRRRSRRDVGSMASSLRTRNGYRAPSGRIVQWRFALACTVETERGTRRYFECGRYERSASIA